MNDFWNTLYFEKDTRKIYEEFSNFFKYIFFFSTKRTKKYFYVIHIRVNSFIETGNTSIKNINTEVYIYSQSLNIK